MDRTELIAWLEAEEIAERERVELSRGAGCTDDVIARYTLRAERFAACRRAIEAEVWREAQG